MNIMVTFEEVSGGTEVRSDDHEAGWRLSLEQLVASNDGDGAGALRSAVCSAHAVGRSGHCGITRRSSPRRTAIGPLGRSTLFRGAVQNAVQRHGAVQS